MMNNGSLWSFSPSSFNFSVMFQDKNGKEISVEVAIMLKLDAGTQGSVGTSAPVSLLDWSDLDWYNLDQELILVLERPGASFIKLCVGRITTNGVRRKHRKCLRTKTT